MVEAFGLFLSFCLCISGMGWIALSMEVHWFQVMPKLDHRLQRLTVLLRIAGFLSLLASLVLCLQVDRPSMASLVWIMLVALSAFVVALTLAYKPAVLRLLLPVRF